MKPGKTENLYVPPVSLHLVVAPFIAFRATRGKAATINTSLHCVEVADGISMNDIENVRCKSLPNFSEAPLFTSFF